MVSVITPRQCEPGRGGLLPNPNVILAGPAVLAAVAATHGAVVAAVWHIFWRAREGSGGVYVGLFGRLDSNANGWVQKQRGLELLS